MSEEVFQVSVIQYTCRATHVPVGDDQLKHIELSRYLAKSFNSKFGILFPEPSPMTGQ